MFNTINEMAAIQAEKQVYEWAAEYAHAFWDEVTNLVADGHDADETIVNTYQRFTGVYGE